MLSTHLLSTHLLSASLAISLTCYQPHLLSPHLLSNSFTINSVAITFICYQASFAIRPQLQSTHLLSSLTCYLANLLSILSCNQQFCYQSSFAIKFSTCSQSLYLPVFFLKIRQKMKKFLKIWNSSVFGKLCVGMEPAGFVASSKGTKPFKRQQ